ncbi:MAG TPA: ThuA domain-containing protein [Gemmatimonadales bacterium]|nr:ThuA domain-containing protein [Gemmatimonadales bacterium]
MNFATNTSRGIATGARSPPAAVLRVEDPTHPATVHLPRTFASAPNEWYRWEKDLRQNRGIDILVAIDPTSFPLGTGPKPNEIWRSGYYPVVWTNRGYRMMYFNMGHNDIDYEHKYDMTNRTFVIHFQQRDAESVDHRRVGLVGSAVVLTPSPSPVGRGGTTQTRLVIVTCVTAAEGTCSVHA